MSVQKLPYPLSAQRSASSTSHHSIYTCMCKALSIQRDRAFLVITTRLTYQRGCTQEPTPTSLKLSSMTAKSKSLRTTDRSYRFCAHYSVQLSLIVLGLVLYLIYGPQSQPAYTHDQTWVSPSYVRESRRVTSLESTLVVQLSKPLHRFHSDHWFHIAEYYITNSDKISSNSNGTTHFGSSESSVKQSHSGHSVVIIVAPDDPIFLFRLSPMTFFFLLLSFTDKFTRTALVIDHGTATSRRYIAANVGSADYKSYLRSIYSLGRSGSTLKYDVNKSVHERFQIPPLHPDNQPTIEPSPKTFQESNGGNYFRDNGNYFRDNHNYFRESGVPVD